MKPLQYVRQAELPRAWRRVYFNCDFGKVASFFLQVGFKMGKRLPFPTTPHSYPANDLLKDLITLGKLIHHEGARSWRFLMRRNITMETDGTGDESALFLGNQVLTPGR